MDNQSGYMARIDAVQDGFETTTGGSPFYRAEQEQVLTITDSILAVLLAWLKLLVPAVFKTEQQKT